MLLSLILPTFFILLSLSSVTPRPIGPSSIYQPRSTAPASPHVQLYHRDLTLAERSLSPPPPSGPRDATTRRPFRRFIMGADYASGSGPPAFLSKSTHKRQDDSLGNMAGSTAVQFDGIKEEVPPKALARSTST
ncbi:hypothetical protein BJV74DRAFT_824705 [Russula compacta]|nr:hypothetical protein BJV74DRAFT_824705 [Russula compacta]